uniref:Uncharacterized protein n=1 Tax=Eutreptiella gymnastica TaxID=73025 RepID=A0A7S4LHW2_9EUGL
MSIYAIGFKISQGGFSSIMVGPSRANMEEEQPSLEMPTCTAIVRQMAVSTQVHNTQMEGVLGPLHRKPHPSALIHADLPQPAHSPASVSTPHTAPRNTRQQPRRLTVPDGPRCTPQGKHAAARCSMQQCAYQPE